MSNICLSSAGAPAFSDATLQGAPVRRPTVTRGDKPQTPTENPHNVCVDSGELLRGRKAVDIHHNGSVYRLQATRLGKLILTK